MSHPPSPIKYATPFPPRRRRPILWITLLALLVLLLAMFGIYFLRGGGVRVVVTPIPPAAATPAPMTIVAPTVPSRATIVQRREQALDGTGATVFAQIGDITRGQTLLTIRDANGNHLLTPRSVREGDIHSFTVGPSSFDIELVELHNFLTGEDFCVFEVRAASAPLSEAEKTERLLTVVAGATGIVFIRNGEEHAPAAAAEHLRRKLESAGKADMTARRFIDEIASKSSLSGEEYRVKLPDGKIIASKEWFSDQLRRIEERRAAASKPAP